MTIQFWFEYASTYSYPAAMRLEAAAEERGITVEWCPFLLGPLFHSQQGLSDSPFNAIPVKGRYMWRDLERVCEKHGFPLVRPSAFPRNGLLAARATLALDGSARPHFVRGIYQANFVKDEDISSIEIVSREIEKSGHNPETILARAASSEIKTDLRTRTERAIELGLFGAPSFVTPDKEIFWGNDRLDDALDWCSRGA